MVWWVWRNEIQILSSVVTTIGTSSMGMVGELIWIRARHSSFWPQCFRVIFDHNFRQLQANLVNTTWRISRIQLTALLFWTWSGRNFQLFRINVIYATECMLGINNLFKIRRMYIIHVMSLKYKIMIMSSDYHWTFIFKMTNALERNMCRVVLNFDASAWCSPSDITTSQVNVTFNHGMNSLYRSCPIILNVFLRIFDSPSRCIKI